jgi:hypothetical protein
MLQSSTVFVLQKNVKAFAIDLNQESARRLTKHERHLGEWNGNSLSPYSFLLVIDDELTSTFALTRIEMKEDAVKVVVVWSSNVDAKTFGISGCHELDR